MGSKRAGVGRNPGSGSSRAGSSGRAVALLACVAIVPIFTLLVYSHNKNAGSLNIWSTYPAGGADGGQQSSIILGTVGEGVAIGEGAEQRGMLHSLYLEAGGGAHDKPSRQVGVAAMLQAEAMAAIASAGVGVGADKPASLGGSHPARALGNVAGAISSGSAAAHSVEAPSLPWMPPAASVNQEAVQLETKVAKAILAIKAGPEPVNKNPPGSTKNHPADPWTTQVEHALTAPPLDFELASQFKLIGPRKRLLVCLFTGGDPGFRTATDQADRVAAVEASWADTDVYWVTRRDEGIDLNRRIRLPDEAETGGYKKIWKKSLHLFHYLTHTKLGLQYDYIFKGDDDTFVNLEEMREVLGAFDPTIPAQYGNNLYGVGARGAVPAPSYYWQNKGINSCHGGAGYAISRGAMEGMAEHWLGCATEWPGSGYEDATVAFCLMRHVGTECFGMKNEFGWDRYHNTKRENVPTKLDALEQMPARYAAATTFHPVPPEFQSRIHNTIAAYRSSHMHDVNKNRARVLGKSSRGYVAQWNCTIQDATPPTNGICQQYATVLPPLAFKPRAVGAKVKKLPTLWDNSRKKAMPAAAAAEPEDAVFVVLDETLTPDNPVANLKHAKSAEKIGSLVTLDSKVEIVHMTSSGGGVAGALPGYAGLATMLASFLRERGAEFKKIALLAGAAALFQRDPFSTMAILANGVTVFVTDTYSPKLTDYNIDIAEVFRWMGVCSNRDRNNVDMAASRAQAKNEPRFGAELFRGPGLIDTGILLGSSAGLQVLLAEFVYEFTAMPLQFRRVCAPKQSISRLIWNKQAAERVPLMIPAVKSSPVVNLGAGDGTTWKMHHGFVENKDGFPAVVVLTSGSCMCCSADEIKRDGYINARGRAGVGLCPQVAMAVLPLLQSGAS